MIENKIRKSLLVPDNINIKSLILVIRGQQVMMDSDLAKLYGYEVKRLNEMVKNNIERFPSDFMFQLNINDFDDNLRSKFSTLNASGNRKGVHRKYMPYVFTEQGIYALSGVLKGPLATTVSINLIRAFKELKDFYIQDNFLLDKVIDIEARQIIYKKESDYKFNKIFNFIDDHREITQKIFFKDQIYDAYSLLVDLILKSNKEIILIDNYVDKITLDILSKKNRYVDVSIYTNNNRCTDTDINKFNEEYPNLAIYKTNSFHDRFLILDSKSIYLIGASLKDAGNKCFGIIEIDEENIKNILKQL